MYLKGLHGDKRNGIKSVISAQRENILWNQRKRLKKLQIFLFNRLVLWSFGENVLSSFSQIRLSRDLILVENMHLLGCFVFGQALIKHPSSYIFLNTFDVAATFRMYRCTVVSTCWALFEVPGHSSVFRDAIHCRMLFLKYCDALLSNFPHQFAARYGALAQLHSVQKCSCQRKESFMINYYDLFGSLQSPGENGCAVVFDCEWCGKVVLDIIFCLFSHWCFRF